MTNRQIRANTSDETQRKGWTNFETWLVYRRIETNKRSQTYWGLSAKQAIREAIDRAAMRDGICTVLESARFSLAMQMKNEVLETSPVLGNTIHANLLEAVIDSVNWHEIAGRLLDESCQ
jgi:hypothetical protein